MFNSVGPKKLAEMFDQRIERFPVSGEINRQVRDCDAAIKLVQIARQNVEQVKSITNRLSPQKITEAGIKQADEGKTIPHDKVREITQKW